MLIHWLADADDTVFILFGVVKCVQLFSDLSRVVYWSIQAGILLYVTFPVDWLNLKTPRVSYSAFLYMVRGWHPVYSVIEKTKIYIIEKSFSTWSLVSLICILLVLINAFSFPVASICVSQTCYFLAHLHSLLWFLGWIIVKYLTCKKVLFQLPKRAVQ